MKPKLLFKQSGNKKVELYENLKTLGTKGLKKNAGQVKITRPARNAIIFDEYNKAEKAASLNVVPRVDKYKVGKRDATYMQDYAGEDINPYSLSKKEQYKLGSQLGRLQKRLDKVGLVHDDLDSTNIIRPNPNKRKVFLIDNPALSTDQDLTLKQQRMWALPDRTPKAMVKGYNDQIKKFSMYLLCDIL